MSYRKAFPIKFDNYEAFGKNVVVAGKFMENAVKVLANSTAMFQEAGSKVDTLRKQIGQLLTDEALKGEPILMEDLTALNTNLDSLAKATAQVIQSKEDISKLIGSFASALARYNADLNEVKKALKKAAFTQPSSLPSF